MYLKDSRALKACKSFICSESNNSAWSPPPHCISTSVEVLGKKQGSPCKETVQVCSYVMEIAYEALDMSHKSE